MDLRFALACMALALAGCSGSEEPAPPPQQPVDPAIAGALADQILIDPDLVGQNEAAAVAYVPTGEGGVPTLDIGTDAIQRAREEAVAMVGGPSALRRAPEPAADPAALIAAGGSTPACAQKAQYTMAWAAKLPEAFPVYPRGAVQDAAGSDGEGCALRVVNFQTPVPLGDVLDFYYTRALAAGFSAERARQDSDELLAGRLAGSTFILFARRLPSGATEVDLVTSGA